MKKWFLVYCCGFLLVGCASFAPKTTTWYSGIYVMALQSVDCSDSTALNNSTIRLAEDGRYVYENDAIKLAWTNTRSQFEFIFYNKFDSSIKINWDDLSYINYEGQSCRIIHKGIKYTDKSAPQASTVIPKNSYIDDLILPVDNIFYRDGWHEENLVPSISQDKASLLKSSEGFIGKNVQIIFPIQIKNVIYEYIFTFNVDKFVPNF